MYVNNCSFIGRTAAGSAQKLLGMVSNFSYKVSFLVCLLAQFRTIAEKQRNIDQYMSIYGPYFTLRTLFKTSWLIVSITTKV